MTFEERMELDEAIQEFEDNVFHSNMKPEISDKAKVVALKCMLEKLNERIKVIYSLERTPQEKWVLEQENLKDFDEYRKRMYNQLYGKRL